MIFTFHISAPIGIFFKFQDLCITEKPAWVCKYMLCMLRQNHIKFMLLVENEDESKKYISIIHEDSQ